MNKSELIREVAKTGLSVRESEVAVEKTLVLIARELTLGRNVTLTGFGRFSVSKFKERKGINPRTGEAIIIQERKMPVFKACRRVRALINSLGR